MARKAKSPVTSRTERKANKATLKARAEPYYSQVGDGIHVGYRSNLPAAGQWVARKAIKKADGSPSYSIQVIGTADDILDSDWSDESAKSKAIGLSAAHLVNTFKSTVMHYNQAVIVASAWAGAEVSQDPNLTLNGAIDLYLASLLTRENKKPQNVKIMEYTLKRAQEVFGAVKLEDLTLGMIDSWVDQLTDAKNKDGTPKMARSTVNKSLQMLKACLNFAYSKNRVTSDKAWRGVKALKGAEKPRKLALTVDQVQSLIDAAEPQALKDLVKAAFLTGARYGELVGAKVSALNGSVLLVDGKTGERDMNLSVPAQEHFARLAKGKKPDDLLLPDESGKLWGRAINRLFRKACVGAGLTKDHGLIEDPVFYTLRHTYATLILDTGTPPSVVAENMGNSEKVLNGFYRKHIKDGASAKLIDLGSPRLKVVA